MPQMFQIVPLITANLSWKFHENLLIHFTVMLLKGTLMRLKGRQLNSLGTRQTD